VDLEVRADLAGLGALHALAARAFLVIRVALAVLLDRRPQQVQAGPVDLEAPAVRVALLLVVQVAPVVHLRVILVVPEALVVCLRVALAVQVAPAVRLWVALVVQVAPAVLAAQVALADCLL
jgi:hypothetical protein